MSDLAVASRRSFGGASSSAGSVLIIDDEAEIRESLCTLLELEGYEVEAASSGEEGLARIGERPFDLVLLDLALPDRNGLDILADLRAHDGLLSVIMITAYGTVESAVRAMQSDGALASLLAGAQAQAGDWRYFLEARRLAKAVTAADLLRLARQYLTAANRTDRSGAVFAIRLPIPPAGARLDTAA